MAIFKRYNSQTQQWEVIGGGSTIQLADLSNIGGVKALKASVLVSNLCDDSAFQTWCDAQTPPIDYTSSRTWDSDFNTILQVYTKYTQDVNDVVELWGSNLLDDVSSTNQVYPIVSITTPSQNNFGVIKSVRASELVDTWCNLSSFQDWCDAQTPPIDYTSSRTWDSTFDGAMTVLKKFVETYHLFDTYGITVYDDIDNTNMLFVLASKQLANETTIGGVQAFTASNYIDNLCEDNSFQTWCDAQTPPIDYTSSRTWDSTFDGAMNVLKSYVQDEELFTDYGINLLDDIDDTNKLYPLTYTGSGGGSISTATRTQLGGIKAVNATDFVTQLCSDSDFQDWCDAQTPPIDYTSSRTWDDDFTTIATIYSQYIESENNVASVWGTNILDNVDGTKQVFPISSIGVASNQNLGVVKGAIAYNSTYTQPVVVDSNGRLYTKVPTLPSNMKTNYDYTVVVLNSSSSSMTYAFEQDEQYYYYTTISGSSSVRSLYLYAYNGSINYIGLINSTSTDIDIAINGVYVNGAYVTSSRLWKPDGGICLSANSMVELSVFAFEIDGIAYCIITSSSKLVN